MPYEGYRNAIFSTVYRKRILVHFCISNIKRTTRNCLVNPRQLEVTYAESDIVSGLHGTRLASHVTVRDEAMQTKRRSEVNKMRGTIFLGYVFTVQ